ncbi:MAG: CRTAC1 family protein [Acidobacteria bacterium]|nr:MAG: CRTAC1 family protein [Acidobacteriota bacterium]
MILRRSTVGMVLAAPLWGAGWLCGGWPSSAGASQPGDFVFEDVTTKLGVDFRHRHGGWGERWLPETMGAGVAALDYDGDGWTDLFFVQSGRPDELTRARSAGRLYRNLEGRRLVAVDDAMPEVSGYGQGALAGDYDGDGHVDLLLLNLGRNTLLRNRGDGTFVDVTISAGLGARSEWSSSAVWFDADSDGDPDLYVVNYLEYSPASRVVCRNQAVGVEVYCHPDTHPAAADAYYSNQGDGTFVDRSDLFATDPGKGLGAIAGDFTGDGKVDLYVANDSTPNFLFVAQPDGSFREEALFHGVSHNAEGRTEAGMGLAAGDVDGNGLEDILVTNLSLETNTLYMARAHAAGVLFDDATRQAGLHQASRQVLGFGVELADLDNDRDLDLVVGNGDVIDNVELVNDALRYRQPTQVFAGDGEGRFELAVSPGVAELSRPKVVRGLVVLDLDNDGRLDLALALNDSRAEIHANRTAASGHLTLRVVDHDRHLGAEIVVRSGESSQSAVRRRLRRGSSYQSSSDERVHVGVGAAGEASVEFRTRCGRRRIEGLTANANLVVSAPTCDGSSRSG